MKIRVVSSREDIFIINSHELIIHLAFRPSNEDIIRLIEACPEIEAVLLSPSYKRTISKSTGMFLEIQRIHIIEGNLWSHRKDLNGYYDIPFSIIKEIKDMKYEGKSTEDILKVVSRNTKTNPEMVAYILTKEFPT